MDKQTIFKNCNVQCYLTDNNFAYKYDVWDKDKTDDNFKYVFADIKLTNFVPTYDTWCLACGKKNVDKRCTKCRSVYFCNVECQKVAWKIHKKHCGRNVFKYCATCCKPVMICDVANIMKCDKCPVKFCSQTCKDQLYSPHKSYDCNYFEKTFGDCNIYNDYTD
jgi:hypothetical protein